ncbi:hypothetical protein ACWGPT_06960 [Pseudorhizobium sp. NPDC055634]
MNLTEARALYPEARELAGLVSDEWAESYNITERRAEVCIRDGLTGEIVPIAQLLPECSFDDRRLMFAAPRLLRALLLLLEAAFDEIRKLKPKEEQKDFAAEVSMKCKDDRAFARYLEERHELQDASNSERIKTRVRSILAVQSLAELNSDPQAAERWKALRSDFKTWLRMSR